MKPTFFVIFLLLLSTSSLLAPLSLELRGSYLCSDREKLSAGPQLSL